MNTSHALTSASRPRHAADGAARKRLFSAPQLLEWATWSSILSLLYSEITGSATIAFIGSYNLTVVEPVLIIAIAALVSNLALYGFKHALYTYLILTMSVILAANFALGFFISPSAAFLSVRGTGLFAVFLLIGAIGAPAASLSRSFERAAAVISPIMCALVGLRLIFGAQLFIRVTEISAVGVNDGGRPLSTYGAMLLGVAAVLLLSKLIRKQKSLASRDGAMLTAILASLLLTGQGTANICAFSGFAVILLFQKGSDRSVRLLFIGTILIMISAVVIFIPSLTDPTAWSSTLPENFIQSISRRQGNYETRRLAWAGILISYNDADTLRQLFGWPSGTMPFISIVNRNWGHVVWTVSAHNMYLGTLITHGIVGAICFALILISRSLDLLFQIFFSRERSNYTPALLAILVMLAIFCFSYDLRNQGGLMIAVALIGFPASQASAATRLRRQTPA